MVRPDMPAGPPEPSEGAGAPEVTALRRLRWRARRGLLENDILIERFLRRQGDALAPLQARALESLLDLSEPELLELLLGHSEPTGALDQPEVRAVLRGLRAAGPDPI